MPDLIYRDLGIEGSAITQYVGREFGLAAKIVGKDIVITEASVASVFPLKAMLLRHEQLELIPDRFPQIAKQMASRINVPQPNLGPVEISSYEEFGKLSEVVVARDTLAASPAADVPTVLATKVLPLLRGFGSTHVTSITINAHRLQSLLSLVKVFCLAQQFGPTKGQQLIEAGQKDRDIEPLGGVLPSPFDLFAFIDALTRFSPLAITLAMHRLNCAWHFQNRGLWSFPRGLSNAFVSEFSASLDPLATEAHLTGLTGLRGMNEKNVWRYLSLVTAGIDRLFGWLGDPRSFQQSDGTVDLVRQLQGFSAVHLLFADLAGMQIATSAHNRISFAMSALDKLANLRIEVGGATGPDKVAFGRLCSADQAKHLIALITRACSDRNYDELGRQLADCITAVYDKLHEHIAKQDAQSATSEQARVDRLWSQRNVRHGTFLRGKQFEKLFLESSGTVPTTLSSVPFLLALGLICDPASFITYDPYVAP